MEYRILYLQVLRVPLIPRSSPSASISAGSATSVAPPMNDVSPSEIEDSDSKETARDLLRKKIRNKRRNGRGEEDDVIAEVVRSVSNGINGPLTIRLKPSDN